MKMKFYISFGLGNVHRHSYAEVLASNEGIVRDYASRGMFPGWSNIYTEEHWNAMEWRKTMHKIPVVEELP